MRARRRPRQRLTVERFQEERRRTGRYLAVCLTLVMLVIACYHVLMRQMPVLVGLLAPAVIMILYLIWLLYFAMKRKRTEVRPFTDSTLLDESALQLTHTPNFYKPSDSVRVVIGGKEGRNSVLQLIIIMVKNPVSNVLINAENGVTSTKKNSPGLSLTYINFIIA